MKKTTQSKALALFMAVLIAVMCSPFAFAAEELSASNVESWPTISYNNEDGKMYYGQTLAEAIQINDDEVVLDSEGNQVAGHFEFKDPSKRTTPIASTKADLTFVPDDTSAYTSFTKNRSSITYSVQMTDLVLADTNKPPVVAVLVKQGTKLSEIEIVDGKVKNPYYENEEYAEKACWVWNDPDQVVSESGEYDAYVDATNLSKYYNSFTAKIKIEIEKELITPVISENPVVNEMTYAPDTTWADAVISGGKVIITNEDGTTSDVEGNFTVSKLWETTQIDVSQTEIEVIFNPVDSDLIASVGVKVPVKVNPAPLAFKDADGNVIPDGEFIFEVVPNEKMNNVETLIKDYLIIPSGSVISIEDYYSYAVNGKKYKLTVNHSNPNYCTELTFTLKFKETVLDESDIRFFRSGEGKWRLDCGSYSLPGEFTVYAIVNGTETEIGKIQGNHGQVLEWTPPSSGDYTFRVEYTPAEDDYFIVSGVTTYPLEYYPDRYFAATGSNTVKYKMGETVAVVAPATDPAQPAKPYYAFASWEIVSGNPDISAEQLESAEFEFAMPDENVELKATYKFDFIMFIKYVFSTIVNWFKGVFASIGTLF